MLGRWQPWHDGHTELFKRVLAEHGQVCIMIRDVCGADAGMGNNDNPFDFRTVKRNINAGLESHGYKLGVEYEIYQRTQYCQYKLGSWGRLYIY